MTTVDNSQARAYARIAMHRHGLSANAIDDILTKMHDAFDELTETEAVRVADEIRDNT